MDLIQIKIKKDSSLTKYIKIIRDFDKTISMCDIKNKIEKNDFILGFDLECYDVLEDLQGEDKKQEFANMIKKLCDMGADVCIYQNGEKITAELLNNWIETLKEISENEEIYI